MSEQIPFDHHRARMRVLEVLVKDMALTGPYHLNGNTVMSNQSHPVAEMSESFHRQVETSRGVVTSDDGVLFAVSFDLLQEYLELRRRALAFLDAEKAYNLAHLKGEAGAGVTLKAQEAEESLRELLST